MNPMLRNYQELKSKFADENLGQEQQDTGRGDTKDETVDDIMSKIKKIEESEKIMAREEFKQ